MRPRRRPHAAICSSTGLGNTSEPKIAVTRDSLTWSISEATSRGDGSAKSDGWMAQWNEMISDPEQKIGRPRQLYTGATQRDYVPVDER